MLNIKHYLNKVLGWVAICLALIILSLPASAKEPEIRVGSLKIKPSIKYQGSYQKNVFFENDDERDDYVQTLTPKIIFEYAGGTLGNYLTVGYDLDLVAYADYEDNNYQAHKPWISLAINNFGPFYLKVNERYVYTADPYGSANTYGIGSNTKRWNNTLDFLLGRKLADKYALELMYDYYLERFREDRDKWQNRIDHRFGVTFLVKVASKTALFGEYRRTDAEYDEQNSGLSIMIEGDTWNWNSSNSQDYTTQDFFIGARFHPSGRIRGEIKFGYGRKDFQNSIDPDNNLYEDDETWVVETDVQYTLLKKTTLLLSIYRSFLGTPDYDSTGYVETRAGIDLTHSLNRTTFHLGFDWNLYDYLNEKPGLPEKYFQLYTIKAGMDYRLKEYLTVGVNYKHQDKDASHTVYEDDEYTDDIFSFYGDIAF